MDVYTDQHTISQDFPSKNNILIDEPDFSDKEEWPTEECFEIVEIFKWRDISDGIYRIKNVTHRKGKFGDSAILTLNSKDSDDFRVWAPKRLVEDLVDYPYRFVKKNGCRNVFSCVIGIKTEIELSVIKLFSFTNVEKLFHM